MQSVQIHQFPAIPQTPADDDVLAIEVNGITYKVSKAVLAAAIANNITPGDIGAYTKNQTDAAIAQSTATLNMYFSASDITWDRIYNIVSHISSNTSALFTAIGASANVLTGGKMNAVIKGLISCGNAINGVYDFMAFTGYQSQYIWIWRISGLTSASATPTVGTVYRFTGTAL